MKIGLARGCAIRICISQCLVYPHIKYLQKSRISFYLVSYYILISMHMSYFTRSCISPHFVSRHIRMSPHLVYPHILNLPKSRILSYLVSHHISYCSTILCISTSRILPYLLFTRYRNAIQCHLQALLVLHNISYLPLSIIT